MTHITLILILCFALILMVYLLGVEVGAAAVRRATV
jgi:hypothetical protein